MTGRKKSVSRKKIGGRKGGIWESRKGQRRLSRMADQREHREKKWSQAPDSDNAMHQIKTIKEKFGMRMLRWRGEFKPDNKRQSGFMVMRDGDVLYKGPEQKRAWSAYRNELGHRQKVIQQAQREARELAALGNDPNFQNRIARLLLTGDYKAAALSLEGYAESFGDEDITGGVREVVQELKNMAPPMRDDPSIGTTMESPYPFSEDYYRELAARERFEADEDDDILHFDEDDTEDD